MKLLDYMEEKKLNKLVLVGTNSQGKTHLITNEFKNDEKTVFVMNEVKADENLKNSTDSSTLIDWINSLLSFEKIEKALEDEIKKIDLNSINGNSLKVSLDSNFKSYKGMIAANIETNSNKWGKPGSGEKFLGQLLLISKMLENNTNNKYKCLVIDEPERHLHPSLYIKIAETLKKISKQKIKVIIVTHSPLITQLFVEDTLEICKIINGEQFFLQSTNELINILKNSEYYKNDNLLLKDIKKMKNNFDLYFRNFVFPIILKSLFCNYMLIGEGAIERKIFELYFEKYESNREKNNIGFAIVDGKPFLPIVIKVLKETKTNVIVLYDKDNENDKKYEYLNKTIEQLSEKIICFEPKIENYLKFPKSIDKYRDSIILINQYFLCENENLKNLFKLIDSKIQELNK